MSGIYVSVSQVEDSLLQCDVDSAVVFFIYKYLHYTPEITLPLHVVVDDLENGDVKVELEFLYKVHSKNDLPMAVKNCSLPVYYLQDKNYCFAGLCAVLRQVSQGFSLLHETL